VVVISCVVVIAVEQVGQSPESNTNIVPAIVSTPLDEQTDIEVCGGRVIFGPWGSSQHG
jgi:hypothetical protein